MANFEMNCNLDDNKLVELYSWVDQVPLSRVKKNISRDFSDGVLFAEVINHFVFGLVNLQNYTAASTVRGKIDNWEQLKYKVLTKLQFPISKNEIRAIATCQAMAIEVVLYRLKELLDRSEVSTIDRISKLEVDSVGRISSIQMQNKAISNGETSEEKSIEVLEEKVLMLEKLVEMKNKEIDTLSKALSEK